ncbi:MAG: hypothetical protein H6817_05210 [Phycisphaerales bacterium]|nr:hypothetical protein [Phycisphaerales bacterium]
MARATVPEAEARVIVDRRSSTIVVSGSARSARSSAYRRRADDYGRADRH